MSSGIKMEAAVNRYIDGIGSLGDASQNQLKERQD
jgi:hypothetical protein